jgi:selenium metabolism protein YedF
MKHTTIDARGLACPQPVLLAKEYDRIVMIVDNASSAENVRRLGASMGCSITIDTRDHDTYHIHLSADPSRRNSKDPAALQPRSSLVVAIPSDTMGRGNDELGAVLIKSFMHTLLQMEQLPDTLVLYNSGVRLTAPESDVLDDLKHLAALGVTILVCGTCTNFFGMTDQVAVGNISNMLDIVETLSQAERLVTL